MQKQFPRPRGGRDYEFGRSNGPWLFCWNVKLHHLDLSFESVLAAAETSSVFDINDPKLVNYAREKYSDANLQHIEEWAIRDTRLDFCGDAGIPENHAYTSLHCGDDIRTRYGFMGRSGGWLVMTEMLGWTLDNDFCFFERTHREVRAISEMVWYVTMATQNQEPERAVERAAAWILFSDIQEQ